MRKAALFIFTLYTFHFALIAQAADCCKCFKGGTTVDRSFCVNVAAGENCSRLVSNGASFVDLRTSDESLVSGVTCESGLLNGNACETISSGGASAQCRVLVNNTVADLRTTLTALGSPAEAGGTAETVEAPFTPIDVELGVEIGGVSRLSGATKNDDTVSIPFLGEYVNLVYRYLVGIVMVVAIVMVVYGGFRYLTGSTTGNISRGKEIIRDALIGMLLTLGAYMILNTINPATVLFPSIRLRQVDRADAELNTIESPTGDEDMAADGEVNPVSSSGLTFTPPEANPYTSCPVSLAAAIATNPYEARDSRAEEFIADMSALPSAGGTRETVLRAARAAVLCDVHMGSCGSSSETINEVAGISGRGNSRFSVGSENIRFLTEINQDCVQNHPGDRACKINARRSAYERFRGIDGWPNEWARTLRPGDFLQFYTAHSGGAGQHATIFLGWEGPGRARLFNGQWERSVNESTYCITTDCARLYPITKIWSPD